MVVLHHTEHGGCRQAAAEGPGAGSRRPGREGRLAAAVGDHTEAAGWWCQKSC